MTPVGIDAIEIRTGKLQLDLPNTFAPAKGDDPEKYTAGLGIHTSSFPDGHEDIVTMGANAAYRLMTRLGLTPDDIGRIDVATESAFDNSKPVSTYIAGCLEQVFDDDFHHANKGERKFACIAGTQALNDACNWISAGRNRGRHALVIATDTALYARGDPGEATQGAGAIAMLVTENPSIVALSSDQGYGSADETDFLKPNQQFPSVDGKRSVQVYLSRMREALEDYEAQTDGLHPDDFVYAPFHTPFPGMVKKAALLGYRHLATDTDVESALADRIGAIPRETEYETREFYEEAIRGYMDELKQTTRYQSWYETVVKPTLNLSSAVGNWYTGSVHIARASALKHAAETDANLVGEQLLIGSYGSGAQAEIHAERVRPGWRSEMQALNIDDQLERRYDLTFDEYQTIHDLHNHDKETEIVDFTAPENEFVFTGWGDMDEREYKFIE